MKKISKIWIGVGLLTVIVATVWVLSKDDQKEGISFKTEKVMPQTLKSSITATEIGRAHV